MKEIQKQIVIFALLLTLIHFLLVNYKLNIDAVIKLSHKITYGTILFWNVLIMPLKLLKKNIP